MYMKDLYYTLFLVFRGGKHESRGGQKPPLAPPPKINPDMFLNSQSKLILVVQNFILHACAVNIIFHFIMVHVVTVAITCSA